MTDKQDTVDNQDQKDDQMSVGDYYKGIDEKVQTFTQDFISYLPSSKYTSFNTQLIVNNLLTIKESAKLLINNYAIGLDRDKETKND